MAKEKHAAGAHADGSPKPDLHAKYAELRTPILEKLKAPATPN